MARNVKKAGAGLGSKSAAKEKTKGKPMASAMRGVIKKYAPAGASKTTALGGGKSGKAKMPSGKTAGSRRYTKKAPKGR